MLTRGPMCVWGTRRPTDNSDHEFCATDNSDHVFGSIQILTTFRNSTDSFDSRLGGAFLSDRIDYAEVTTDRTDYAPNATDKTDHGAFLTDKTDSIS